MAKWWQKALGVVSNVAAAIVPGGNIIKSIVDATGVTGSGGGSTMPVITVPKSQLTGGGVGGLPALPTMSNAPVLAASAGAAAMQNQSVGGILPWWRGPGGKLQMPWNDPRIPEYLKQFAIDDAYLKQYVRAPRGYVIVRDANGNPFGVNKWIAQKAGIWKPSPKPMLTSTDVRALRRAASLQKKLAKLNKTFGPKIKHVKVAATKKR
jgi:hypothetical protein